MPKKEQESNRNPANGGRDPSPPELPPAPEAEREQAIPELEEVRDHGPIHWGKEVDVDWFEKRLESGQEFGMVVLAADIRSSTFLMKEAADFLLFAQLLSGFVGVSKDFVRGEPGGWFDKFTGDGFLCYWVFRDGDNKAFNDAIDRAVRTSATLLTFFHNDVLPDLRRNSLNFTDRVGLSIGLDAGSGFIVEVGGAVTIVGQPVVGAVRMVTAAEEPWVVYANVYIGEHLYRMKSEGMLDKTIDDVVRLHRSTKESRLGEEYERQEIYEIKFPPSTLDFSG